VAARERLDAIIRPLAGCYGCRANAKRRDVVRVLFAFSDEGRSIRVLQQLRPAVKNASMRALINPAAMAVRLAMAEALRFVAAYLIEQLPVFVPVIVDRDRLRFRCRSACRRHNDTHDIVFGKAFAVWLKGRKSEFLAYVIATDYRVISSKTVHQKAVRCASVDFYAEASIVSGMIRAGTEHFVAIDPTAKKTGHGLQIWKRACTFRHGLRPRLRNWRAAAATATRKASQYGISSSTGAAAGAAGVVAVPCQPTIGKSGVWILPCTLCL